MLRAGANCLGGQQARPGGADARSADKLCGDSGQGLGPAFSRDVCQVQHQRGRSV